METDAYKNTLNESHHSEELFKRWVRCQKLRILLRNQLPLLVWQRQFTSWLLLEGTIWLCVKRGLRKQRLSKAKRWKVVRQRIHRNQAEVY